MSDPSLQQIAEVVQDQYPDLLYRIISNLGYHNKGEDERLSQRLVYSLFIYQWYMKKGNEIPNGILQIMYHIEEWSLSGMNPVELATQEWLFERIKAVIEEHDLKWAIEILAEEIQETGDESPVTREEEKLDYIFVYSCFQDGIDLPSNPLDLINLYVSWINDEFQLDYEEEI